MEGCWYHEVYQVSIPLPNLQCRVSGKDTILDAGRFRQALFDIEFLCRTQSLNLYGNEAGVFSSQGADRQGKQTES